MLTRQTWSAAVSAIIFVSMAAILAVTGVPFVAWSPGATLDILGERDGKPVIEISGVRTFDTSGQLNLTTVAVTRADAVLSLPEALLSQLLPDREVLPREAVYPAGQSPETIKEQDILAMATSQQDAIVAALRAAGEKVIERPMVSAVVRSGPAEGKLEPGDLILKVDQSDVETVEDVRQLITAHNVGESVTFTVIRDRQIVDNVTVLTQASNTTPTGPVVGVVWETGYSYDPRITINVDPGIGGPSAGLVFAVGIYDQLTSDDLIGDRIVAGTGTITTSGDVGSIGGIREKIAGARGIKATLFLVPAGNCDDIVGVDAGGMTLVKVETLSDAISALERSLVDPSAELPRCDV
jgi:PDZ domain-containing protein